MLLVSQRVSLIGPKMRCIRTNLRTRRIQLSTDGLDAYRVAVQRTFGDDIDYWVIVGPQNKRAVIGNPDPCHISTTFVGRPNLTTRMVTNRFIRKGNAYSRRLPLFLYSAAIVNCYHDFCRPHMSLPRSTPPAMAAELTDRTYDNLWLSELVEASHPEPKAGNKPGPSRGY